MNERDIVQGCRSGNPAALRALAETYYDRLFRVACGLTRSRHLAEDLTQETFTASLHAVRNFRGASSLFTWLVAILRRQWLYRMRSEGRLKLMAEMEANAREEDSARKEARLTMREAIERMEADDRAILELFYTESLRYAEIAEALDIPLGTVKSRLNAARTRLKEMIGRPHAM